MSILDQFAAVAVVLILLGGGLLLLKKSGRIAVGAWRRSPSKGGPFVVLDQLVLTNQHALFLVQACGQLKIVATCPSGIALSDLPPGFSGHLEAVPDARPETDR